MYVARTAMQHGPTASTQAACTSQFVLKRDSRLSETHCLLDDCSTGLVGVAN